MQDYSAALILISTKFFGVGKLEAIPILTTLIWQNTAHQPKAVRLIREFQQYKAQIIFKPFKPLERLKWPKKKSVAKEKEFNSHLLFQ